MKKFKLSFKGNGLLARVGMPLLAGTAGAGLKMGTNYLINTLDKDGKLTPMAKHGISLGVPILGAALLPKLTAKPLFNEILSGYSSIVIYQAAMEEIQANYPDIAAKISGYSPYGMAGYSPSALAGINPSNAQLPFQRAVV